MPLDDPGRLCASFDKIVEVAREIQVDDQSIGSSTGPYDSDLMIANTDRAFVAHPPTLNHLAGLHVPDLDRLVRTGGHEALRIPRPRDAEDAALVLFFANLPFLLSRLSIVKPNLPIRPNADQDPAVRTERDPIDKAIMFPQARVELERRAVVEPHAGIVAPCRGPKGPLLPHRHAVDLRAVAGDFAHGIARIRRDAVAEFFSPVPHGDDASGVAIPCQVVDAAPDELIFSFSGPFSDTIPHPDRARYVSAGNVVS